MFQSEIILSSLIFYPQIMFSVYSSFWLMSISKLDILVAVYLVIPQVQSGVSHPHSFSWLFPLHPLCSGLFPHPHFFSTDNSVSSWKLFYESISAYSSVSAGCVSNKRCYSHTLQIVGLFIMTAFWQMAVQCIVPTFVCYDSWGLETLMPVENILCSYVLSSLSGKLVL